MSRNVSPSVATLACVAGHKREGGGVVKTEGGGGEEGKERL